QSGVAVSANPRLSGQRLRGSADFQSAVSPISNRQFYDFFHALRLYLVRQSGSPAIQQIGNLRYFRQRFFISFEGFCLPTSHERIKAPMKTKFFITLTAVLLPIAFGPRAVSAEPLILIVATNGTPSPDGIGRFVLP